MHIFLLIKCKKYMCFVFFFFFNLTQTGMKQLLLLRKAMSVRTELTFWCWKLKQKGDKGPRCERSCTERWFCLPLEDTFHPQQLKGPHPKWTPRSPRENRQNWELCPGLKSQRLWNQEEKHPVLGTGHKVRLEVTDFGARDGTHGGCWLWGMGRLDSLLW